MSTTNETIRAKFAARLNTNLAGIDIEWENIFFDRSGKTEWVRVRLMPGETFNASMGRSKKTKSPGFFMLTIFVKRGTGTKRCGELADSISDIFRNWREVDGSFELDYGVPSQMGTDNDDENLYWRDIKVPFVAEDIVADVTS